MPNIIPAVTKNQRHSESTRFVQEDPSHPSGSKGRSSYGATAYVHDSDSPRSRITRIEESDEEEQAALEGTEFVEDGESDDGLDVSLDGELPLVYRPRSGQADA